MTSSEIKLLLSSAVDGRTRDLRYRQNQLLSLHQWIANHRIALEHAIERDEHVEEHEAQFVVSMTLREVQAHYDELDLTKALEEEYRVKNGRNNAGARSPEALIYVIPEKFTLFYSALSTLSACIAAGSCCIIEVRTTTQASISPLLSISDKILHSIVTERFDSLRQRRSSMSVPVLGQNGIHIHHHSTTSRGLGSLSGSGSDWYPGGPDRQTSAAIATSVVGGCSC